VDRVDQPDFLNLVCEVETGLEPEALLQTCQKIEAQMGRVQKEPKGPRNIDIDILFYGQRIVKLPFLKIPHPALHQRNFVLIPLEEIDPEFKDPVTGKIVHELRLECGDRSSVVKWGVK
jgi:2-amino-4-hydroxy-6-hydroxymethyldihydropteridine diphosphokinase